MSAVDAAHQSPHLQSDMREDASSKPLPLYVACQICYVLQMGAAFTAPLALMLHQSGLLQNVCLADFNDFYNMYSTKRLFSLYIMVEILVTRASFLLELQHVLALTDGRPLMLWAAKDRLIWLCFTFITMILLDIGIVIWPLVADDVCDEDNMTKQQYNSMRSLCLHSIDPSISSRILHGANMALGIVLMAAVCRWWIVIQNQVYAKYKNL